ncbi:MAG: DNA mismatch repair protein MutS [Cellulophaga sp.]
MSVFQIGDTVEAIDDITKGVIVKIKNGQITIESSDGFQLNYSASELIKVSESSSFSVSNYDVAQIKSEKESLKKRKSQVVKAKDRNAPKMEVDLHIHQLIKFSKGMSNHEILNIQLDTAKRQLDFAMRKRISKIVFIHGVGEGILKEELHYLFGRYEGVKFYEADYQKYGLGGTEVYIYQNA